MMIIFVVAELVIETRNVTFTSTALHCRVIEVAQKPDRKDIETRIFE